MEEMMQKVVDQKMELELQLADIVDGQNIKAESARMKMKKIEKYALQQEKNLRYAFGAIVILVAVIISMLGFVRCAKCSS